jgi:replication fork clamp-binding protein CrfC
MLFIDREKNKALLKYTDNAYNPYSKYFDIIETDENGNPLQVKKEEVVPQVDYSKFVTVEQLNGLPTAEQYQELFAQYTSLLDQVNNMKKIISSVNIPKSNEKVLVKEIPKQTANVP